jgi:pimeloyl-ACP methyl ester carboxylesterase
MGILFLVGTIAFVTTFIATSYPGIASAQENKTVAMQSQELQQSTTAATATAANNSKMNIVLVHGAWVDGSTWSGVMSILQKAGYKVIAVQLPLHSLADDVATTKRAIDVIGGPVILVGHSYGGEVISNAAYNNPNVKGLVYVAAFAPDEGQAMTKFVDPSKFPKGAFIVDNAGFGYINQTLFHDVFAQDVDPTQANILAYAQKPFNMSTFEQKSGPPTWKQLPTWYQVSADDRAIPPDVQRMFAKQMNATTISLPTSHASYVSHPNEVAQLILDAAKGSTK